MTKAIRLSPSGPLIKNANGGTFTPGEGTPIRQRHDATLVDQTAIAMNDILILGPTFNTDPFIVELPDPRQGCSYSVDWIYQIINEVTESPDITMTFTPRWRTLDADGAVITDWTDTETYQHWFEASGDQLDVPINGQILPPSTFGDLTNAAKLQFSARFVPTGGGDFIYFQSGNALRATLVERL